MTDRYIANLTRPEREHRLAAMRHRQDAFNKYMDLKAQAIEITPEMEMLQHEMEMLDEIITPQCRQGCGLPAYTAKGDCEICAGVTEGENE